MIFYFEVVVFVRMCRIFLEIRLGFCGGYRLFYRLLVE